MIGGSLAPGVGGHNPLEAARLGCPFLAGPHVEKWPVYAEFLKAGAGECVLPGDLGAALASVLADPARSAAMAASARDFTAARDLAAREAIGRIVLMAPP